MEQNAQTDFMDAQQPSEAAAPMEDHDHTAAPDGITEHDAPQYPDQYDPDAQASGEPFDIAALDLQTEEAPPVDEDKLADRMEYAPQLQAGKFYRFLFKLDETKPAEGRKIKGKDWAQYNYELTELRPDGSTGKVIKFLNATNFRSGKMEASRAEELLFALYGSLQDYNATQRKPSDILRLLQEASTQQRTLRGQVQWRRYDSDTKQSWSTAPQKPYDKDEVVNGVKTGNKIHVEELPWPKDAQGHFIARPPEFEGNYGSETVSRVMPEKELLDARRQPPTSGATHA